MTGLQIALLAGTLTGLGLAILVWRLAPAHVDPADFTARTSPTHRLRARTTTPLDITDTTDRLGVWATKLAPPGIWRGIPTADLDLLNIPLHRHYGRKALFALGGLTFPALCLYTLALGGFTIPTPVPAIASLTLAAFLFIVPDIDVRADARDARDEMVHALTAYLDLIALQRKGASGPRQAMTRASEISQGWVFRRIAQELRRSEFEGSRPWDALRDLARRIDVPELDSLANIMDLSERSGARVYDALRARATSLRNELQNTALAKAHAVNERMEIPIAAAAAAFMTILLTPAFLRLLNS